ncbi:MAG: hypothetical protein ACREJC_03460 [Tepidisphaeraceae bacterium]
MNGLTFHDRGVVEVLWALLRTQTAEVGAFVRGEGDRARAMPCSAIATMLGRHASNGARTNARYVERWVARALASGLFRQRESDGAWYSPRIIDEAKYHETLSTYGRKGAKVTNARGSHYNRVEAAATPAAKAAAYPEAEAAGRAEADAYAEAEQPRARVRDYSGNHKDDPTSVALERLERLADVDLMDSDRSTISDACAGKSKAQIEAAVKSIVEAYRNGRVKTLVPFAAKLIRDQPPVRSEQDRDEQNRIKRAQRLCTELNIPWKHFHVQALAVVETHPHAINNAASATWDDYRAKLLPTDATPAQWWERFAQHVDGTPMPEMA